jgi:hypothetical protein
MLQTKLDEFLEAHSLLFAHPLNQETLKPGPKVLYMLPKALKARFRGPRKNFKVRRPGVGIGVVLEVIIVVIIIVLE